MMSPSAVLVQLPGEAERRVVCAWCQADNGRCVNTGGGAPCEGEADRIAAAADLARTPFIGTVHLGGTT